MNQSNLFDPYSIWKTMYDQTETNLSELIHETLQKESFAEYLGLLQNGFLQYNQWVQNATDTYLKQLNLPTREEISSIASLVINLEGKIEDLDEKMEDDLLNLSASSEISQLKTSISKLEKKMDLILDQLNKLGQPIAKTASPQK